MSTRSGDQQKKQRQKEFLERKAHKEALKAQANKAKRDAAREKKDSDEKGE